MIFTHLCFRLLKHVDSVFLMTFSESLSSENIIPFYSPDQQNWQTQLLYLNLNPQSWNEST